MSKITLSISLRLKGFAFLLLLTGAVPLLHAEEENTSAPVSESVPAASPSVVAAPGVEAMPPAADSRPAVTESAKPTLALRSNLAPEALKSFVEAHPREIQWCMENSIPLTAGALALAIFLRMRCGKAATSTPKRRSKEENTKEAQRKTPEWETAPHQGQPTEPEFNPATLPLPPEQEEQGNPFRKVLKTVLESPASNSRDGVIEQTFLRWTAVEKQSALEWALGLADAQLRDRLVTTAVMENAERDPGAAIDLSLTFPSGPLQEEVVNGVVRQWTRRAPDEAAAKIISLPQTPVLPTAIMALVETWSDIDIQSTGQWLGSLPVDLSRDLAFEAFIQRIAASSPESAAAWVETIDCDEIRCRAIAMVAEKWKTLDPGAANVWADKMSALFGQGNI